MKTTKTKISTIISVFMVIALLYACTKDSVTPEPYYDCMRIENGTAILDDCGECHKWLAYNYVTHSTREVNDTINEDLLENEQFTSPNSPANPLWNACGDCMGVVSGLAALDDCGTCHQSYIYDFVSHETTYIDDTAGLVLAATEMLILAGSAEDIANNPTWNGGPLVAIDDCGDCHSSYIYDFTTHIQTYINDTVGLVLEPTEIFVLAGSPQDITNNPNWNAGCK